MIDEIQALMPLLEKISDGAVWAFAIYMFVKGLAVIVWPITVVVAVYFLVKYLSQMVNGVEHVKLYDIRTKNGCRYVGKPSEIEELFDIMGKGYKTIGSYEVRDTIKKLESS